MSRTKQDIKFAISLNEEQKEVKRDIIENEVVVVSGRAGCLGYGTKVLMYDGYFKEVQDVEVGDKLMGVDSKPRNVLELFRGKEQMYWVRQKKGKDYRVNENHILSLKFNKSSKYPRKTIDGKRYADYTKEPLHPKQVKLINISVKDFLALKSPINYLGYISPKLNFSNREVKIDPYYLGLHLGDGNTSNLGITSLDEEIQNYILKYHKSLKLKTRVVSQKNTKCKTYYPTSSVGLSWNSTRNCVLYIHENIDYYSNFTECFNQMLIDLPNTTQHLSAIRTAYRNFLKLNSDDRDLYIESILDANCDSHNTLICNFKEYSLFDNKHIPEDYLLNSENIRLQILAGILDSDGYLADKGKYYDLTLKDKKLIQDVAFLCGSLGFKFNLRTKNATMKRPDGSVYKCLVYRLSIMGYDLYKIPCRLSRKKISKREELDIKNHTHTGIHLEKDIVDDYYGFALDGDHLFILEDFTVTHNSGKSLVCAATALDLFFQKEVKKIWVTRPLVETGRSLGYLSGDMNQKFDPYLEAFKSNLITAYADTPDKKAKIENHLKNKDIDSMPIGFIRGKTIGVGEMLVIEESQSLYISELSAIISRLGKGGRIVFNGDFDQVDIKDGYTGFHYLRDMSKDIKEIKWHSLKSNHRSDLLGKILEWEHQNKKKGQINDNYKTNEK